LLHAPVDTCVFLPNATTGVNTVLRNLVYQPGDVIVYFTTIYGACHKTISYLEETTPLQSKGIELTYPISDEDLCSNFEQVIRTIKDEGKKPKIAIFDSIVSMPGVRVPFERLVQLCRLHNTLSLIDGAHSAGQIPIDLTTLDPDFYVSNLHKWLHVPRGCAIFYCPVRHQPLMRSSLPTSHGFVPRASPGPISPLAPSTKSEFVNNFEFTGTIDNAPYLCVPAALAWRSRVRWEHRSGEDAVMQYCIHLASRAGQIVASALGDTSILEHAESNISDCAFANVELPLSYADDAGGSSETAVKMAQWMSKVFVEEYDTFMAIMLHGEKFWVRLSAQIYLTEDDFKWAGATLKDVCERVRKGEWADEGSGID
jgi:selenocysteine lyase/cysteine desulfurase